MIRLISQHGYMSISDRELYARFDRLQAERAEAESRILTRCIATIKEACSRGVTRCQYTIPDHVMLIMPHTVDKLSCANYLQVEIPKVNKNLRANYLGEGIMDVDWSR
mgnify:CR=1 FL=1